MLAPFQDPFFQRALLAGLLIGFTNGFFSGFVVLRRTALSVSALSHTMLPGIALGILVTGALTQANAFIGALAAALFVGLGSVVVSRSSRVAQSTALAILYTSAFALGAPPISGSPLASAASFSSSLTSSSAPFCSPSSSPMSRLRRASRSGP
jgi:manganese/iron transport system permease protein/iron/zinc/copper transport system permease protein